MTEANPTTEPGPTGIDALTLLREDHRRLDAMFDQYQAMALGESSAADRSGIVSRIGGRLRIHARIEDEIFYPALPAGEALDRARAEHERLESEIGRIAGCALDTVDGAVEELATALREHARFEEETIFPLASGLDLQELGARLVARRIELIGNYDQPD